MWWEIAKLILGKNNSPAWNRVNNIMNLWNMAKGQNSARTTYSGAVDNSGMYGAFGG